jgi:hypothetical protein
MAIVSSIGNVRSLQVWSKTGSNVVPALALLKNLLFSQELHLRDRDYLHRLLPQYHS